MKKISKVLAVALVLVMLVASSVLPASAADLENASLKLTFTEVGTNDKVITSATKDTVFDVYVSLKVDAYVQAMQFYVNYNSDYVTQGRKNSTATNWRDPSSANAGAWLGDFTSTTKVEPITDPELFEIDDAGDAYGYYWPWGMGTMSITPWNPDTMPAPANASTKGVKVVYATKTDGQTLLVNTKGEYLQIIQMRFKATQDISNLNDVFFFDNDYEQVIINIDSENVPFSTLAVNAAKNLNVTFEYEGGSAAPSYTVNTLEAQVQWADKEAGLMNLGFRGQFVGFDVEADKDTTVGPNGGTNLKEDTQLKEVGIILTKGTGSGTKYPVHTVYNFKDGGYFYRLVVGNVSYTGTEEFSAKAYVVIGNDTFEASNTITTTGAAQYNRAKDQMGAK